MTQAIALKDPEMIQPEEMLPDNIPGIMEDTAHFAALTAELTNKQKRVLVALANNVLADKSKTDVQIAKETGVERSTLPRMRRNPNFSKALALLMREIVIGSSDQAIRYLIKLSEKDTAALKVRLNIANIWQSTQHNLNVNAQIDARRTPATSKAALDDFLCALGSMGWTSERIRDQLVTRFEELRAEGAF